MIKKLATQDYQVKDSKALYKPPNGFNQVLNSDLSQYIVPSFEHAKEDHKNASVGRTEIKELIKQTHSQANNDASRHFSFSD